MKIKELELKKFRGFEQTTFNFHNKVNVLVGVNGAGKTSVLDALASLLEFFQKSILGKQKILDYLNYDDIKIGSIDSTLIINAEDKKYGTTNWSLYKHKKLANDNYAMMFKDNFHSLSTKYKDLFGRIKENIEHHEELITLLYYTVNRLSASQSIKSKTLDVDEYFETLNKKISSFENFEKWYIIEENKENRVKIRTNPNYLNPNLKAVRKAIEQFFKEIDGSNVFSQLYVDEPVNYSSNGNQSTQPLGLYIHKKQQSIRLSSLSEGEKMLILLISDIARRLTIASNHLEDFDALQGKGIVLIDEIELHLHPKWQRKVVQSLVKVFPNVQFFLTTHSPQVLSSIPDECVYIIEDFELVPNTPQTKGRDSNSILWDIFGVKERPVETQKILDKFYNYLDDENKEKASDYLNKISSELGKNDTAVQKAKLSYEFSFDF